MTAPAPHTSRWGRSKFGGTQTLLILLSLAGGTTGSLALAWGLYSIKGQGEAWIYLLASFSSCFLIFSALTWALLVDRSSITGATKHPEQTIENHWYQKATESTFHALLILLGLASVAFLIFPLHLQATHFLAGIWVFLVLTFFISYQVHKRTS